MAITIDWASKVISVPQADLTFLGGTDYELDIDSFRLTLKDLEDDEDGIVFIRTHNHNPPVTVSGVTLARVVELINGYTITFEDGQYAVNLVGANSNISDVLNLNQVSIRAANSAGLIETGTSGLTSDESTKLTAAAADAKLARQLQNNRQEIQLIGGEYYLVTYDDDDSTVLFQSKLTHLDDGVPTIDSDAPAKRERGT